MSRTAKALIAKFLLTLIASWIAFSLVDNPFVWILFVAFAGTILNYLIGDLLVLPALGNIVASIGDGGLGALVAYLP